MKFTAKSIVLLSALTLFLIGLLLAFTPIHREGSSCGTAFTTSHLRPGLAESYVYITQNECNIAQDDRRTLIYIDIVPTVVLLVAGLTLGRAKTVPGSVG